MADLLFDDLVDGSGGLYFDDLSTAPTAPAILDVDTDEVLGAAQLGATFACLNGGATIGDRVLALVQGSTVVAQTQVAGNDTGGTFNVTGFGLNGLLKYGTATKARLTVGAAVAELDLATPSGQAVPFVPPTGRSWVQFGTLEATLEYRIEGVPVDIASGDQFEYVNQGGTVTVLDTGVVTGTTQAISSLTGRLYKAGEGWGPDATIVIEAVGEGLDTEPPTAPTWPASPVSGLTPYGATLTCNAAVDDVGVAEYVWYVNGDFVSPVTAGTSKTLSLGPGQRWTVRVAARDGAGNESEMSPSYTFTTPPVGVPTSPPSWARR